MAGGCHQPDRNEKTQNLFLIFCCVPLQTPAATFATATRTACAPSSSVCPPGSVSSNAWGVTATPREPSPTWWTLGNTPPPSLSSPSQPSTPLTEVGEANARRRKHGDGLWKSTSPRVCFEGFVCAPRNQSWPWIQMVALVFSLLPRAGFSNTTLGQRAFFFTM